MEQNGKSVSFTIKGEIPLKDHRTVVEALNDLVKLKGTLEGDGIENVTVDYKLPQMKMSLGQAVVEKVAPTAAAAK